MHHNLVNMGNRNFFFGISLLVAMTVGIVMFNGCSYRQQDKSRDAIKTKADSLVLQACEASNFQRALALIDSLEETGDLSSLQADYYRGEAYSGMEQTDNAKDAYRRATADHNPAAEDYWCYQQAAYRCCNLFLGEQNLDSLMQVAVPVISTLDSIGNVDPEAMAMLRFLLGYSCTELARQEEGKNLFKRVDADIRQWLTTDTTGTALMVGAKIYNNITMIFLNHDEWKESELWAARVDSLIPALAKFNPERANDLRAFSAEHRAEAALGLGRKAEANKIFEEFLTLPFAETNYGKLEAAEFLSKAGRYAEAADKYAVLDDFMAEHNSEMNISNLWRYLLKFKTNCKAGRKDSALYVANQFSDNFKEAIERERQSEAAELAAIYDTQGKERQIAQQRVELSQQRWIATAVALVLVIIFFIIYALARRRHVKRLAEKNEQLSTLNTQLTIANERAKESSRMKTNFIQQISHEIRTPLNILSGFTQVVTTPGIELGDKEKADINRQITENTDRITGLVNKMLELSDANSISVIERTDQVTAVQIAAEAADASGISNDTHLTFDMKLSAEAETAMLTTNQHAATRALSLILDNARKFTKRPESTSATITVQPSHSTQRVTLSIEVKDNTMQFIVEDTGIGVPLNEADRIFDEFVQLDEYYEGTGIGLTVARSLARRLGGDVTLDTTYTDGARFVMTLPL